MAVFQKHTQNKSITHVVSIGLRVGAVPGAENCFSMCVWGQYLYETHNQIIATLVVLFSTVLCTMTSNTCETVPQHDVTPPMLDSCYSVLRFSDTWTWVLY